MGEIKWADLNVQLGVEQEAGTNELFITATIRIAGDIVTIMHIPLSDAKGLRDDLNQAVTQAESYKDIGEI